MSLQVTFTTDGSSEGVTPSRIEVEREFRTMDICRVMLPRPVLNSATVVEDKTKATVSENGSEVFSGVVSDVVRGGSEPEVIVNSPEHYAREGERSGPAEQYENVTDSTIYADALGRVPNVSLGNSGTSRTVSYVYSFSSPAKMVRQTAESVGKEVEYETSTNDVNIVDSRGNDQTSTTISPANANISGNFEPERKAGNRITHLVMLGAGEGDTQQHVLFAPSGDSTDYEGQAKWNNVERYTASDWSSGDRKRWDAQTNKDVTDVSTLRELGKPLIEDLERPEIEVQVTFEGSGVLLGDEYTVASASENFSEQLRVVKMTEIFDSDGHRYDLTLSNRRLGRQGTEQKLIKDTERYNMAFEGNSVPLNAGGSRQPVGPSNNYYLQFFYPPDVVKKQRLNIHVIGLPYRAYAAGGAAGEEHSHEISASEFAHKHSLTSTVSTDSHDHSPGQFMDTTDHDHTGSNLDAGIHDHNSGFLVTADHDHGSVGLSASQHGHDSGTYDSDSHEHDTDITTTSTGQNFTSSFENGNISLSGTTGGTRDGTISTLGFTGNDTVICELTVELTNASFSPSEFDFRFYDGSSTSSPEIKESTHSIPLDQKSTVKQIIGLNERSDSDLTIEIDATDSSASFAQSLVDYRTLPRHEHEVTITGATGLTGPAVGGTSAVDSPDVDGTTENTEPDVSGETDDTEPSVDGTTSETSADVTGDTDEASPGVSGETTDAATATTTDADSSHTHPPWPGVIEQFPDYDSDGQPTGGGPVTLYPSSCDVLVNGNSLGKSFGAGSTPFDRAVNMLNESVEFSEGINTIEVTSNSIGHIMVFVEGDLYRQVIT